jgi:type V secretory pathway adhesin AidA
MDSSPTLQDFVLNLIYDPAARSAFEMDPESVLQHAGLGDITAADVQQVIPLVVDYAPVTGITGLAGTDDLTTGVANLDVAGAVAQLQTITSQVAFTASHSVGDLNTTVAGVNTTVVGVTGDNLLSGSVFSGSSLGVSGLSDISAVGSVDIGWLSHDPGLGLDHVVAPVEGTVTDHLLPVTNVAPLGALDAGLNAATTVPSSIDLSHSSDLDVAGVHGATSSVVGSLIDPDLGGDLTHDPVRGLEHSVTDVGHGVTGTLHGITHPTEDASGHDLLGGIGGLHL